MADIDGFRVVIYSNDHRPSHVHVIKGDHSAVFFLNCPNGPVQLREVNGTLRIAQVRSLAARVEEMIAHLCDQWRQLHGDF